ncbi:hypothetical protein CIK05_05135 [Bdellovibrio sp. qaytius]|nr:hypothetical protein CIK05_05135 [Bdellovibrio sp. qaytius]
MSKPDSSDRLTTRNFWVDYWAKTKVGAVSEDIFFKNLMGYFPKAPATCLEIGGFPGSFTTYFRKFHNYDVTLLDYVVVEDIVREVEKINGLNSGDIKIIEGDLFELVPPRKFDVVFSAGFIEHFKNVDDVFHKHVEFMKDGGTLYMSVPNFKGISGYAQKWFDKANYDVHNIDVMEKSVFEKMSQKHNLKIKYLDYYGRPNMWLDHPEQAGVFARKFVGISNIILRYAYKFLNGRFMTGRQLSPFIILIAEKSN